MSFIDNRKFSEIREAAKNGNEKALMVIQAMKNGGNQSDIDGLVSSYYQVDPVQVPDPELGPSVEENSQPETVVTQPEVVDNAGADVQDLGPVLDSETDGLFDENDIEDTTFSTFLSNKRRDGLRAKKNADYFKAFDANGRETYMNNKINGYKDKFNGRLRDIERRYNDMDTALNGYMNDANLALDDANEFDVNATSGAYDDLTGNEMVMGSMGRHWDAQDNEYVKNALNELMQKYGKKNVIAALNTLKSDNTAYRDYLNNQVDEEVGRYTKSVQGLLK